MDTCQTEKKEELKVSIIAMQDQFKPVIDQIMKQDLEGIDCLFIQDQKNLEGLNFEGANVVFILSDMVGNDCMQRSLAVATKATQQNILTFYLTDTKQLRDSCLDLRQQTNATLILSDHLTETETWEKSYALVISRMCQQLLDKSWITLSLKDYREQFNVDMHVDYALSRNTCDESRPVDILNNLINPNKERLINAKSVVAMVYGDSQLLLKTVNEAIGHIEDHTSKDAKILCSISPSSVKEDQFEMLLFISA